MQVNQLAQQLGVHRTTVTRWIKQGIVPAVRTPGGRHIIGSYEEIAAMQTPITDRATLYIYIPLPEWIDREAEISKLQKFAEAHHFSIHETVIEGSHEDSMLRKQLLRLLSQPTLRTIITNRQSLPLGWKFLATALAAAGRRFIVADAKKPSDVCYKYQSKQLD